MSTPAAPVKIASTLTDQQLKRASIMYLRGVAAAVRAKGGTPLLTKVASRADSLREQSENHIIGIHLLGDLIRTRAGVPMPTA